MADPVTTRMPEATRRLVEIAAEEAGLSRAAWIRARLHEVAVTELAERAPRARTDTGAEAGE